MRHSVDESRTVRVAQSSLRTEAPTDSITQHGQLVLTLRVRLIGVMLTKAIRQHRKALSTQRFGSCAADRTFRGALMASTLQATNKLQMEGPMDSIKRLVGKYASTLGFQFINACFQSVAHTANSTSKRSLNRNKQDACVALLANFSYYLI